MYVHMQVHYLFALDKLFKKNDRYPQKEIARKKFVRLKKATDNTIIAATFREKKHQTNLLETWTGNKIKKWLVVNTKQYMMIKMKELIQTY